MTTVSVSSFSLWENLGGLRIPITGPDGRADEIVLPRDAEFTIEEFPAAARERLGVAAVEICQIQIADSSAGGIGRLRAALDDAEVALIAMPIDVGDVAAPDGTQRELGLGQIERWISIAGELGARFCRVRAGFTASAHAVAVAVPAYRRLADYADRFGIRLLVENQGGVSGNADSLIGLIDAVGDELGLLLDTGNFEPLMSVSNAKTSGHPLPDAPLQLDHLFGEIERLAPRAELVHAKSHEFDAHGEHIPFDLRRGLEIIRSSGFSGPVSVEYEGMTGDRWTNTVRTLETVRSVFGVQEATIP